MPIRSLVFVVALSFATAAWADDYRWKVLRVVDGDTLEIDGSWLPPELSRVYVRVRHLDTPEKGRLAKCPRENEWSERATAFTRAAVEQATDIMFRDLGWDKYGGRILAEVLVDGEPLSGKLIAAGLARPYEGKKKASWCD